MVLYCKSFCQEKETTGMALDNCQTTYLLSSSYPQPPNLCMEDIIDHAMITCVLAH